MNITAALGICITAAVLSVVLSQYKKEYALFTAVAAGAVLLLGIIGSVFKPINELWQMLSLEGAGRGYFSVSLRALGICFITGFVSDVCRDFGQTALAGFALTAGKCAIFLMSTPLLRDLLNVAMGFIK